MSDDKEPEKRKRPTLYKKTGNGKDEDVLKKLKEVRQSLQDSLDDKPSIEEEPMGPKLTRKRGERKLYKKEQQERGNVG